MGAGIAEAAQGVGQQPQCKRVRPDAQNGFGQNAALVGVSNDWVPGLRHLVEPFETGKGRLALADVGRCSRGIEQAFGLHTPGCAGRAAKQPRRQAGQLGRHSVRQSPVPVYLLGETVQAVNWRKRLARGGEASHAQRMREFAGIGQVLPAALQQPRIRAKDGAFVYHYSIRTLRFHSGGQCGDGSTRQRLRV